MKLEIDIKKVDLSNSPIRIEFKIEHGTCFFSGYDYTNLDEVETLELNLTNLVQQLYNFRKQQGEQQNDQ